MINSMTGYGSAEGQLNSVTYAVEIRTVNGRYFKSRIKLPETASFIEEGIEKLLRKNLSRGTVSYVLELKNVPANALFDIDETALKAYMERLSRIASSVDVKCPIDIGGLLDLPGIVVPVSPGAEEAGRVRRKVLSITQEASMGYWRTQIFNWMKRRLPGKWQFLLRGRIYPRRLLDWIRICGSCSAAVREMARRGDGWILSARRCSGRPIPLPARPLISRLPIAW